MEEKTADGADSKPKPQNLDEKAQETDAEAPESLQEQSGLAVVLCGQLIRLAALGFNTYTLKDFDPDLPWYNPQHSQHQT